MSCTSFEKINMEEMGLCFPLYHSTKANEQMLMSKFDSDRIRAGFSQFPVPLGEPGKHNSENTFTFIVIWNHIICIFLENGAT